MEDGVFYVVLYIILIRSHTLLKTVLVRYSVNLSIVLGENPTLFRIKNAPNNFLNKISPVLTTAVSSHSHFQHHIHNTSLH